MRHFGLVVVGLLLLALCGSISRTLHFEWLRFDPILIICVFAAMRIEPLPGLLIVFMSGSLADGFASTPPGMLANGYLAIWALILWSKQIFMFKQKSAKIALVFVVTLVSQLIVVLHLVVMNIGGGPIWVCIKSSIPNALANALLALPIWKLASKIYNPKTRGHSSILLS